MMPVVSSYAAIDATCHEARPAERWLTPREQSVYAGLRDPARRRAWLAGRVVAKRLVCDRLRSESKPIRPTEIEIDSGDGRARRQRPRVILDGRPLDWRLSIAHSGRSLLVALAGSGQPSVGVDLLEPTESRPGFVELWFTNRERRWLAAGGHSWYVAWAIKEAAYKAANQGEPFRPQAFEVLPAPGGGFACLLGGHQPTMLHSLLVWRTSRAETAVLAMYDSSTSCTFSADGGGHD